MLRLLSKLPRTNSLQETRVSPATATYAIYRPLTSGSRQKRFISAEATKGHFKREKSRLEKKKSKDQKLSKSSIEKEDKIDKVKYITVEQYELEAANPPQRTQNVVADLFSMHKLKCASLVAHLQPNNLRPYGSINSETFPTLQIPTNELLNHLQKKVKKPEPKEIVLDEDLLPKKITSLEKNIGSTEDTLSLNSAFTNFKRSYSQNHKKMVAKFEMADDGAEKELEPVTKDSENVYVETPIKSYSECVKIRKVEQPSPIIYPPRISYSLNPKSNLFNFKKRNMHYQSRQYSTVDNNLKNKRQPNFGQQVRHTSNTKIPGFPEIKPLCEVVKCPKKKMKPVECGPFPKYPEIECEHEMEVDREQNVYRKRLPPIKDSECPCVDPFVPSKTPKLRRLKMIFRDPPRESCEHIITRQRADDCLKPVVKKLKPYEPGTCPCIEPPPMTDVPLPRLKMECEEVPIMSDELCKEHYRADNGCWEYPIDDCPPELEEQKPPCPKVPMPPKCKPVGCKSYHTSATNFGNHGIAKSSSLFANSGLMARYNVLNQSRNFQIPSSDGKCHIMPSKATKKKRKTRKGQKPCKLDSRCPKFKLDGCDDPHADGCSNKRTLICCTKVSSPHPAFSEKVSEELLPYTKRLQWRCGRKAFPVHPVKLNEPIDKIRMMGYCTLAHSVPNRVRPNQNRVYSTCANNNNPIKKKSACEKDVETCQEHLERLRKSRSKELNEKCPIWCLPNCPPKVNRPPDCRDPKPKKFVFKAMKPPYKSFSDKCREAEIEEVYSECPVSREKVRYLQPSEQNSEKLVFFGEPGPKVKIDPLVEENCIRQLLCIKNKGLSQTCTTFGDNIVPLRSKDYIKVIDKDCKEIEKRKGHLGAKFYSTWSNAGRLNSIPDSLDVKNLPPKLLTNDLMRNLLLPKSNTKDQPRREYSNLAPRLRIFNKFWKTQKRKVRFLSTNQQKFGKGKLSMNHYCDNERQRRKLICPNSLNKRCAEALKCRMKMEKDQKKYDKDSCDDPNCVECNEEIVCQFKGKNKANFVVDNQCLESLCKDYCPKIPSGLDKDGKSGKDLVKKLSCFDVLKKKSSQKNAVSFWKAIVNYFKARPNCPTAEELRQQRLIENARKAAQKAGLCIYDPKKDCLCPIRKQEKDSCRGNNAGHLIQKRCYSSFKKDFEEFIQVLDDNEEVDPERESDQNRVLVILRRGVHFLDGAHNIIDFTESKFENFKILDKLSINEQGDLILDNKNVIQTKEQNLDNNNDGPIYFDCKFVDRKENLDTLNQIKYPEIARNAHILAVLQNIFQTIQRTDKKS